jgi:putative Holliday junction resolvase
MRLLGVDPGERRIGLAVSDPEGKVATPVEVMDVGGVEDAAGAVLARARELGAEGIVVGMPVTLRGEVGPAAERVAQFVEELRAAGELPVTVYDERLSTAEAERAMLEAGASRRARRESLDKVAAALILQAYLDRHAVGGEESYRQ